ncbi:MAG: hypothetical protein R3D78_03930 [Paracoccaceae bacterium]
MGAQPRMEPQRPQSTHIGRKLAFPVESPAFAAYFAQHSRLGYRRITAIARRPHNAPPQRDTGPRVNDRIRAPEIRLIGADGENVGVISPREALAMAEEAGWISWKSRRPRPAGLQDHGFRQVQIRTAETRGRGAQEAEGHRDQGSQVPSRHGYA